MNDTINQEITFNKKKHIPTKNSARKPIERNRLKNADPLINYENGIT